MVLMDAVNRRLDALITVEPDERLGEPEPVGAPLRTRMAETSAHVAKCLTAAGQKR